MALFWKNNASVLTRKYTNVIMLVVCHQRKRIWVGTANVWKKKNSSATVHISISLGGD